MKFRHRQPPPPDIIGPRVNYLSRLVRSRFNEIIAEEGLFSGQQDILFAIVDNEGITSSELAQNTGVSAATISISVKRMEKAGFIVKKPDEKDARVSRLYPTEKAKAMPAKTQRKMDSLETTLKRGMSEEQILEFSSYLQLAIDNIQSECESCCKKGEQD